MIDYLVYLVCLVLTQSVFLIRKITGRLLVSICKDIYLIYFLFRVISVVITFRNVLVILFLFRCITFIYYILFLLFYHDNNYS